MKRTVLLCLFGLAVLQSPAIAGLCEIDTGPGATLLLPYFEVDLADPSGINTLFSINNAESTAVLAHVVLWTDLSVATFDFDVYLTGYDIQTVSVRDIFNGILPRTASAGQDPADTISPQGEFSQDVNFASCNGQLPPPSVPASFVTHLRAAHTGKFSGILGGCSGRALDDNIARGYITVDTVNRCTLRFPGDAGYFGAGGTGDASNQNVLWGDYFYIDDANDFAQGETLVSIEADAASPETSVVGEYTFYGRYVGWTAADNREPLATTFGSRYLNGGSFTGGTELIVWRDSKMRQGPFACSALPGWYPLGQESLVVFDDQENPDVVEVSPSSPALPGLTTPFPAEAQRTAVNGPDFPVPFDHGWLYLNLNTTIKGGGQSPPEDPAAAQGWMTTVMSASGRFSVGFDASRFDSACNANHADPGP